MCIGNHLLSKHTLSHCNRRLLSGHILSLDVHCDANWSMVVLNTSLHHTLKVLIYRSPENGKLTQEQSLLEIGRCNIYSYPSFCIFSKITQKQRSNFLNVANTMRSRVGHGWHFRRCQLLLSINEIQVLFFQILPMPGVSKFYSLLQKWQPRGLCQMVVEAIYWVGY